VLSNICPTLVRLLTRFLAHIYGMLKANAIPHLWDSQKIIPRLQEFSQVSETTASHNDGVSKKISAHTCGTSIPPRWDSQNNIPRAWVVVEATSISHIWNLHRKSHPKTEGCSKKRDPTPVRFTQDRSRRYSAPNLAAVS